MNMFLVRRTACPTCIYRDDSPQDISALEGEVTDAHGAMTGYRICHHHTKTCCRGFWNRFSKKLAAARLAISLGLVEYIDDGQDSHPLWERGESKPS